MVGALTFKLEQRLPYKRMLVVTGVMIALVLVVMVGNTVRTLQGVGWLSITPVDVEFPLWMGNWLGIYPTVETLVAQAFAFAFVVGSYFAAEWWRKRRMRQRDRGPRGVAGLGRAAEEAPAQAPVVHRVPAQRQRAPGLSVASRSAGRADPRNADPCAGRSSRRIPRVSSEKDDVSQFSALVHDQEVRGSSPSPASSTSAARPSSARHARRGTVDAGGVVIDLTECTFIDSTGIACVVRTFERADHVRAPVRASWHRPSTFGASLSLSACPDRIPCFTTLREAMAELAPV